MPERYSVPLVVEAQPDETTCGPTCLHAVYRYYGDEIPLSQVVGEVDALPDGGTLAVWLGCHALRRGYAVTLYTYNLRLFDPTWFPATAETLTERLRAQARVKDDVKLRMATRAYEEFLSLGGTVRYEDLTPGLLGGYLRRGVPFLTGLSATYLYRCARERNDDYDDVGGSPTGHFVIASGYDPDRGQVMIADPLHDNPGYDGPYYRVSIARAIGAILLGIVTYDANLLVITPTDPAR